MNVLVVGSGVVGLHIVNGLRQCDRSIQVDISHTDRNVLYQNELFGSKHPTYRDAPGGLDSYWHQVCDLNGISNFFLGSEFGFLNEFIGQNVEFIPYLKTKYYKKIPRKIGVKPQTLEIVSTDAFGTRVRFSDGSVQHYDFVLVCHGALPPNDILVHSGLVTLSGTASDHLIGEARPVARTDNLAVRKIGHHGFLRPYETLNFNGQIVKHTKRAHFGENNSSFKDGLIYSGSSMKSAIMLAGSCSSNSVLNAMYTRYGFPSKSKYQKSFYQTQAIDIYKYSQNNLQVIKEKHKKISKNLASLSISGNLKSGIHYHNTYLKIENPIENRAFNLGKSLILITPQFQYTPGASHFTADLLSIAENIVSKILRNYE